MPTEILMPALSPTMEEGKLAKWLVKEGQNVKPGDIIAEIETDKATMEVEAVDEGKVAKLLVAEGTEAVKVNTPIATLLLEGESAGAAPASKPAPATPAAAAGPPAACPVPPPRRTEPRARQRRPRCAEAVAFSPRHWPVDLPRSWGWTLPASMVRVRADA
jgi:pyruvate/2-oxoglutarate dehydrogenase complex dihydrolipoamide acyltransferase (E2) component